MVKVVDFVKLADIANIQSYVINGSKVIFLRRRPQPRPPKGAVGASQCVVCSRHLQDVNLFCSLQCKMDSDAGEVPLSLRKGDEEMLSSKTGPETPHMHSIKNLHYSSGSDSDFVGESAFKRRKGVPRRAHLE